MTADRNPDGTATIYKYCIRFHCDSVVQQEELIEKLKSRAIDNRWFGALHKTERHHWHWYIETKTKDQAMRSVITKHRKHDKDTRWYSVKLLETTIERYISYCMFKPETGDKLWGSGITEQEQNDALVIAEEHKNKPVKHVEKSKSIMAQLDEHCRYDHQASITVNFNKMYDFLVEKRLYNMHTSCKMKQLFMSWKAYHDSKENRSEYERLRRVMLCQSLDSELWPEDQRKPNIF